MFGFPAACIDTPAGAAGTGGGATLAGAGAGERSGGKIVGAGGTARGRAVEPGFASADRRRDHQSKSARSRPPPASCGAQSISEEPVSLGAVTFAGMGKLALGATGRDGADGSGAVGWTALGNWEIRRCRSLTRVSIRASRRRMSSSNRSCSLNQIWSGSFPLSGVVLLIERPLCDFSVACALAQSGHATSRQVRAAVFRQCARLVKA